jgi:hypothetical protein
MIGFFLLHFSIILLSSSWLQLAGGLFMISRGKLSDSFSP